MKTTLKILNDSYPSLQRLTQQPIPKDQDKLIYKLYRIYTSAKSEIAQLEPALEKLRQSYEIDDPAKATPFAIQAFNRAAERMMSAQEVEIWGDPFMFSEIFGVIPISAFDLGELSAWLIIEKESAKAAKRAK